MKLIQLVDGLSENANEIEYQFVINDEDLDDVLETAKLLGMSQTKYKDTYTTKDKSHIMIIEDLDPVFLTEALTKVKEFLIH